MNPEYINSLVLAYLGDSIIELMTREYLIKESGALKVNELNILALNFVSSEAHAKFVDYCLEKRFFSEQEIDLYKRGRNTKNQKHESAAHHSSTGLEAIIGYLYLNNELTRIKEIFTEMIKYVDLEKMKQI